MDCRTCGKPMARRIPADGWLVANPEAFPWVYPVVGVWIPEEPLAFDRFIRPPPAPPLAPLCMWGQKDPGGPPAICPTCQLPLQYEDFYFAGPTLMVRCPACGFTEAVARGE